MLPLGLCRQVTSLLCRDGGFLTWAAKPSVRESPDPAKCRNQLWPPLPLRRPLIQLGRLRIRPCRSSVWDRDLVVLLGRCAYLSDSKKAQLIHFHKANIRRLFCALSQQNNRVARALLPAKALRDDEQEFIELAKTCNARAGIGTWSLGLDFAGKACPELVEGSARAT